MLVLVKNVSILSAEVMQPAGTIWNIMGSRNQSAEGGSAIMSTRIEKANTKTEIHCICFTP
jgi:hypothetical protein